MTNGEHPEMKERERQRVVHGVLAQKEAQKMARQRNDGAAMAN